MSTDTTVVLVHGPRLVRCTVPILVGLLAFAARLSVRRDMGTSITSTIIRSGPARRRHMIPRSSMSWPQCSTSWWSVRQSCHICCSARLLAPGRTRMSLSWRWQRRPGRAPSKGNLRQPRRLCSTSLGATPPCASRSSVDSCTPSCTRPLANGPNAGATQGAGEPGAAMERPDQRHTFGTRGGELVA